MLDERIPRNLWPNAIVIETLPDNAGLVRRVRVKTADGTTCTRDIQLLTTMQNGNILQYLIFQTVLVAARFLLYGLF